MAINNTMQLTNKNKPDFESNPNTHLDVDIVLGMPSRDCKSFGICKIVSVLDYYQIMSNRPDNMVKAKIHYRKSGKLVIKFLVKSMSQKTKQKYFGSDYFIVNEEKKTPNFANTILGNSYRIGVGNYLITKKKKYYTIVF